MIFIFVLIGALYLILVEFFEKILALEGYWRVYHFFVSCMRVIEVSLCKSFSKFFLSYFKNFVGILLAITYYFNINLNPLMIRITLNAFMLLNR